MKVPGGSVLKATGIIGAAAILVTSLGFLKNLLAAYFFGTSRQMDTYMLALVVPDMAQLMSITGLFNFIPIFEAERAAKGEDEAWRTASHMMTYWLGLLTLTLLACFALARPLSALVGPGLTATSRGVLANQLRLLLFMAFGVGASKVLGSGLYAQRRFLALALGEVSFQVASIAYLVLFHALGTAALVGGMIFGAFCQLLIVTTGLMRAGIRIHISREPLHPAVRKMLQLTLPVYVGNAGAKINAMVVASFASRLPTGVVSSLQYAFMLADTMAGTVSSSVSQALFPFLSRDIAEGKHEKAAKAVERSLVGMALLMIPVSAGALLLARPIVTVLFKRGSFDERSTMLTAGALAVYSMFMLATALSTVLGTTFFARRDTATPMKIGLTRVALTITGCSLLSGPLGYIGIALASSGAEVVKLFLFAFAFSRSALSAALRPALVACARILPAVGLMSAAVLALRLLDVVGQPRSSLWGAGALAVTVGSAAVIYAIGLAFFARSEFALVWETAAQAGRRLRSKVTAG
jgi:putative peptidoglycan lipid II flippase